jgi:hypothetical protein
VSEQFALFEMPGSLPEGLSYAGEFVSPAIEDKLILGIQSLPLQPFSSANSKASGGPLRSVSDTTTACGGYSAPNRSRPGWTR